MTELRKALEEFDEAFARLEELVKSTRENDDE